MTERPLCRDVSLQAARECLTYAASSAAAALLELRDAAGHALIALAQGPTMRAVDLPMPPPSAEAEARFAAMMAKAREAMAQHDTLMRRRARSIGEPVCICGDCPVVVGEPCAACAEVAT